MKMALNSSKCGLGSVIGWFMQDLRCVWLHCEDLHWFTCLKFCWSRKVRTVVKCSILIYGTFFSHGLSSSFKDSRQDVCQGFLLHICQGWLCESSYFSKLKILFEH